MPEWERRIWRDVFDLYGPLDWKRDDMLIARVNQYQAATSAPLKDFILFTDPTERETGEQTEEDLLKAFGYTGE